MNFNTSKFALVFTLMITAFCLNAQDFKIVGYFPIYRFDLIEEIKFEKLTHLNIAFANPDKNGQLSTYGVDIIPVVQRAHDEGLDVFIALAGAGAVLSDWEEWIAPASRAEFKHGIIEYAAEHNLQGIDLDLEGGDINDDYSGFALELRDSVKYHGLGLSAALPGMHRYSQLTDEALASFDWINIMAYDVTGPWSPNNPGPHSPEIFAVGSINFWFMQGVDKDRLTLGVPFYGWDFTDQSDVVYHTFSEIVAMNPKNAQYDQVGQIYYNGLPTIENKTKLALDEIGGIMIWELGQDSFDEYSLLNRIHETVQIFLQTSENDENLNDPLIIYPNPVVYDIQIKFRQVQTAQISLFSLEGKVLARHQIHKQKKASIPTNGIPNGVFFIKVDAAEFSLSYKLMKQSYKGFE